MAAAGDCVTLFGDMADRFNIVGIGEALFDLFPDGERLGGAPLNVAVHANQLAQVRGGRGVVVSRVGQDELGQRLVEELRSRGMTTEFIQTDPDRPTGRVYINIKPDGEPQFEILRDAAWDVLSFEFDLEDLAYRCEAVCFGSLAQRDAQSRNAIYRFLDATRRAAKMYDVNLRGEIDQGALRRSCEMASIVKLNERELPMVISALGMGSAGRGEMDAAERQAEALVKEFGLEMVVLTRGQRGTKLITAGERVEGEPASYDAAEGADAVGAGDACAAAILVGRVLRMPLEKMANLANHAGAYVASQPGATPALPDEILEMVK